MARNNRIKKLILYIAGLFILSIGVGISVASNLGVSPVSALPYVISKITGFELGMCTTGVFVLYLLIQIVIMRKEFKVISFVQIAYHFYSDFLCGYLLRLCRFLILRITMLTDYYCAASV